MPRIHLVRHATSESNLDMAINRRKPDHAIELAPFGGEQARHAGELLAERILEAPGFEARRVRFLVSPYTRTRQTRDGFAAAFRRAGLEFDEREENLVREQEFGLFDGIKPAELPDVYPMEHAHYRKHVEFSGEYHARMPMGESRSMVCDRVRGCFGSILRDFRGAHARPVTDMVVFTHGVTMRCFLKEWLHHPWEWVENSENPLNTAIVTIEGETGRGWTASTTFDGFDRHAAPQQEQREEGHA